MAFLLHFGRSSLILSLFLCTLGPAQSSELYRLGVQDKLRIKVGEWRVDQAELYEWKNLSGESTVDPSGNLTFPLLGQIRAAGLSVDELSDDISVRLQKRVGLTQRPDTTIEIVQFRPFYIVGDVQHPGEYPFRPGMNVLQAISIGGGMYRTTDPSSLRFQREAIASRGDLRVLASERVALLARRARLQAELDDVNTINFPIELEQDKSVATQQVLREELLILQAQRKQLQEQVDSLVRTKATLEDEVQTLHQKGLVLDKQIKLAQRELGSIADLLSKGLAVSSRQLALEQEVARFESLLVDEELSMSRTRQEISKADRTVLELQSKARSEELAEIRQVETKLVENTERATTALKLTYDSEISAPRESANERVDQESAPVLIIVRKVEGETETRSFPGSETEPVQPGDIVKVARRIASSKSVVHSPAREDSSTPVQ